jgi:hypothetical protein
MVSGVAVTNMVESLRPVDRELARGPMIRI